MARHATDMERLNLAADPAQPLKKVIDDIASTYADDFKDPAATPATVVSHKVDGDSAPQRR